MTKNENATSTTPETTKQGTDEGLKREIGLFGGFNVLTGIMVGSGIFYIGSYVLMRSGYSQGAALLVWLIGGIITLISGLCFAELGASMPQTGGTYLYLRKAYGQIVAFMSGSTGYVLGSCGSIAALAVASSSMFANLFPSLAPYGKWIAVALIVFLSTINFFGVKLGSLVQNGFTVAKLIPIVLIIVLGLFQGTQSVDLSINVANTGGSSNFVGMIAFAVLATFWAYEGWTNLNVIAGEIKNPKRNLPMAIITAIGVVTVIYLLFNFAIYRVLSPEEIQAALGGETPNLYLGTLAAQKLLGGELGGRIVGITMLIAVLGATHGCAMVFPRTIFSMSKDGTFFPTFAKVNDKYKTPGNAIILTAVISIVLVLTQDLDQLTTLVTFSGLIFNALIFASIFIFRKREPNMERPYKVWFYPVTPIIAIAVMIYMLINTLIQETQTSLVGLAVTLGSVVLYFIYQAYSKRANKTNKEGAQE